MSPGTIIGQFPIRLESDVVELRAELGATAALWRQPAVEVCEWLAGELGSRRSPRSKGWKPRIAPGRAERASTRQDTLQRESDALGAVQVSAATGQALPRLCGHCERGLCVAGEAFCSAECAADAAVLARLAVELRDRASWSPEAWELLRAHLGRVPASRLMAVAGVSRFAVSLWRSGRRRPRPWLWAALAGSGGVASSQGV